MNSDVLVKVEHVQKKFCRDLKKSLRYGVQDICADFNPFGRNGDSSRASNGHPTLRSGEFWSLDDVSFEVRRGECLGLVGHNGAGKTTLLKTLSGLIKPDGGRVEIRGRLGALIALGAGFNPILTGRENIYINATILGLKKKEISEKLDDIIDFADIGDFIDTPVQSYSSGMQVRLGFAIATAIEPEILLLDEVLAVGDMAFRVKCYNRIGRLQKNAATILVTHDMSYLSTICNRILFMSHGVGTYYADRKAGIQRYIEAQTPQSAVKDAQPLLTFLPPLKSVFISLESERINHGGDVAILIAIENLADLSGLQLRCNACTEEGHPLLVWDSDWTHLPIRLRQGHQVIRIVFGPIHLTRGRYSITTSLMRPGNGELLLLNHRTLFFEIVNKEIYSEIQTTFAVKSVDIDHDRSLAHTRSTTSAV